MVLLGVLTVEQAYRAINWTTVILIGAMTPLSTAMRQSGAAERYIQRFVQAGLTDARRRGLDGIVCGHIHRAGLFEREGCVYANDGDWVESLTALAEDPDGTLRLLAHTGETLAMLPCRQWLPASVDWPNAA